MHLQRIAIDNKLARNSIEREKRKNNLIIHNFPEPTEVSSNEQRALKDTEALTGLFHTEFKVTDAKIRRTTRLGAFKSISARPCTAVAG